MGFRTAGDGELVGEGVAVDGVGGRKGLSMFSRSFAVNGWPSRFVPL